MEIRKFEDFVILLEYYAENRSFKGLNQIISLNGTAPYKDYIFEAIQDIQKNKGTHDKSELRTRLHQALEKITEEERQSLVFSTLTSYFTPEYITQAMGDVVLDYFKEKNIQELSILEPSAGSGKFIFSLLESNSKKANLNLSIDAVELDFFTSKILENNLTQNNNVTIYNQGFQNFEPKKDYELIIGNVPFGQFDAFDHTNTRLERDLINKKIHNYFFVKTMNQLKPGGLLMLMTSKELSDNNNDKELRKHLVSNLNLISAIRFSDTTFKDSKTKVITDLLVFQKPLNEKKELTYVENAYINSSEFSHLDVNQSLNDYFKENPNNVLGEYYKTTGIKGKEILSIKENNSDVILFNKLLDGFNTYAEDNLSFKSNVNTNTVDVTQAEAEDKKIRNNYPLIVPGNLILIDTYFFRAEINPDFKDLFIAQPVEIKINDRERALNLIELRESYKLFRESLRNNELDKAKHYQGDLNNKYDTYSFFYNTINSKENKEILYLESEKEILKTLEREITPGEFQKSDIFSESAFFSKNSEPEITNIKDAIYQSINKYGNINREYISSIYKKDEIQWISEALEEKALFIDPIFSEDFKSILNYQLSLPSAFISGFVEGKISVYNKMLTSNDENLKVYKEILNRNIIESAKAELVKNIPYKLSIQEIDPSLGEPWIDISVFELFGKEHFQDEKFKLHYNSTLDSYKVFSSGSTFGLASYSIRGASRAISYKDVFEYALIQNIPEFTKKIVVGGEEKKVSDKELNTSVQIAVEKLQNAFSEWLMTKEKITGALENQYHILNNAIVKEKFNPDLLNFDNISGYAPYLHQKSVALEHSIQNGGIIDHKVGYGKTLSMAMLCMTKKKFKINKKELVVGLNANYIDIYNAFCSAYPEGRFLLITNKDLNTDEKKKETFYKIANNSWDAIITSHSSLAAFPRAPYTEREVIQQIINEVQATIENEKDDKNFSRGEMNTLLKKLTKAEENQKEIAHLLNLKKESGSLIFDDLGIDGLIIDESHYFKNLEFATRHSRVAGLGSNNEVKKTRNLLSYIRNIQEKNKGIGKYGGISFATGTTISNSISELYTLFKYLIPGELKKKGMNTFDQWARVYARKSYEYEESVTGNIKLKERFRYFVKVPELAKMYYDMTNFADEKVFKVEKPNLEFKITTVEPYPELSNYLECIKKFGNSKNFEDLPYYTGKTESNKAVGLICTSLGRKASLSLKLIDKSLSDNPNDKVNTAVRIAVEFYKKYDSEKGTQMIFCDQGVPNAAKDFDIYNYTKQKLIESGIPKEEIAFIHDYDNRRQILYKKVNSGEVRFLLASTEKGGVGVNVQEKLVALHHFDLPWRPSDLDQRNGRGGRPGNILLPKYDNNMPVFFYATKNTLDSYNFNILQIKNNFISQIKNASIVTRKIDEGAIDSDGNMNFQEYMAACSSNQYLTEKLKIEKELQRLLDEKASYDLRDRQNKTRLNYIITDSSKIQKNKESLELDFKLSQGFNPNIINGKLIEDKNEIAALFNKNLESVISSKAPGIIANLDKEFSLVIDKKYSDFPLEKDNYSISVKTPNNNKIGFKSKTFTKKEEEVFNYPINCINRISSVIEEQKIMLDNYQSQKEKIDQALSEKFNKEDKITEFKLSIKEFEKLITEENKKNDPSNGESNTNDDDDDLGLPEGPKNKPLKM